ncbi:redoxin domain-containing protein [Halostella salina]|uniref:redoxin domain-containing protein n=1 Tax=Halostella salina TaxID=1547897 RepID=UPI000EF7FCFC|nr:redoxin domain-containing protein [Halostella salina]
MIEVGDDAPSFRLPGTVDGEFAEFALDDYVGESIVVLVFYPADFSPTCTDELCSLRDFDVVALRNEVTILGISGDSAYSHRAFAEEYGLGFPLLSDSLGDVAAKYGVRHDEFRGHAHRPQRSVFVVDVSGTVQYIWVADATVELPDLDAVRDAIESVQDDGVAIERYRTAGNHYRYGRSEFDAARERYEAAGSDDAGDWAAAADGFEEAEGYFDSAVGSFAAAERFGSGPIADSAATAGDVADAYRRAAKWFSESADYYADGRPDLGDEYREDAADALASVEDESVPDLYALGQ